MAMIRSGATLRQGARLLVLVVVLFAYTTIASAAPLYDVAVDTHIRSTVLFVGDSNITRGAGEISTVFTTRTDGAHLPVVGSRSGMGIRGYGPTNCPDGCTASDYWKLRIPNMTASVDPDVVVVNLGVNDAPIIGTPTGLGYGNYAAKIDWLMSQFPVGVPIIWTNLPCPMFKPPYNGPGCDAINNQLAAARSRYPQLTLLPWKATATGHPEYMSPGDNPHYSPAGYTAWARMVNATLNTRFP